VSAALEQALCALRDERAAIRARATPAFNNQLAAVRTWQSARIAALHRPVAERYDGHALLDFLTHSFYLEADWSELTARPERVAKRIGRIISDSRPLVIAVRLQASADTLDAAVSDALLTRADTTADTTVITPRAYVSAFRQVGEADLRRQQILWVQELVDLLGGYADNRAAYWAFKLASGPARALGMGRTYGLLADGFAAMRATRDLEGATRDAVALQQRLLGRLLDEKTNA